MVIERKPHMATRYFRLFLVEFEKEEKWINKMAAKVLDLSSLSFGFTTLHIIQKLILYIILFCWIIIGDILKVLMLFLKYAVPVQKLFSELAKKFILEKRKRMVSLMQYLIYHHV